MDSAATIDPAVFREVLGHYPTGVAVITAIDEDGQPAGMVVGSFTSVSMDPPLVAYMPTRGSRSYARLRSSRHFCVNVLAAEQRELCRAFASRAPDKFAGVSWNPAPHGSPILDGAVSWIECEMTREIEGGDHFIVLGEVRDLQVAQAASPLLFFQGGYGRFSLPSLTAPGDPDLIQGVRMAEAVRDDVETLAADIGADCDVLVEVGDEAVFVMTASGGAAGETSSVGRRVPLIPPLGAVFYADAEERDVQRWLDRGGGTEEEQARYRANLAAVAQRGYSLSLMPDSELDRRAVTNDYSAAEVLPEHERRMRQMIAETALLYEPDLRPGRVYDLHSVVVPVACPGGRSRIALRLSRLPAGADEAVVEGWITRLTHAATEAAERLIDRGMRVSDHSPAASAH